MIRKCVDGKLMERYEQSMPHQLWNGTGVVHESVMGTVNGSPYRIAKCTTVQATGSTLKTFERMRSIAGVHVTKFMLGVHMVATKVP